MRRIVLERAFARNLVRPQVLFPLFEPVTKLAGIGPRLGELIGRVAGEKIVDLLWHLPSGVVDRRASSPVADAEPDQIMTLTVIVGSHQKAGRRGLPYRILCFDDSGELTVVYFNAKTDWLEKQFPIGETRIVSGRIEEYRGSKQMVHPDEVGTPEEADTIQRVEPVYALTANLSGRVLRKAVATAVARAPALTEWADAGLLAKQAWPGWQAAVERLHAPDSAADLEPTTLPRQRLAYDELLATQVALQLLRARTRRQKGRSFPGSELRKNAAVALPFTLTGAQQLALREIDADMADDARMLRLLQGDVGSGKTVVAWLAMLNAVGAGGQAALMAPTEVLARQHFQTIRALAEPVGVRVVLLTGREKGKVRSRIVSELSVGEIQIAIGTHALFSDDVIFDDLGMIVIDEQHRFGVHQRMALSKKGAAADVLVMTATPIPRTLLLAAYGDLDSSRLTEKPAGRKPVGTRALPVDKLQDVVPALERAIGDGAQVFWVCPLVEESAELDLAAATDRYAWLHQRFGDRVGLMHGQLPGKEKDAVMARFAAGDLDLLVSTTVIEVGVDVPNASVMVIEHAERFGLAQLHQLRGRIGRGERASTCLLLYQGPLGDVARSRIDIMRETEDGFRIAEEDLRLRGGGEILGTRQSGLPRFRVADLAHHSDLLALAHQDARLLLEKDPELESDRGQAIRTLLYLFERDEAARLLRSG